MNASANLRRACEYLAENSEELEEIVERLAFQKWKGQTPEQDADARRYYLGQVELIGLIRQIAIS